MENKKSKVLSSLLWKFLERGGTQGIQFIIQIVLARILLPSDYGIISLISVFIAIANVFVQSGFNTALIQKKKVDEKDLSSVFYLNIFVSGILYILLFFTAPFIERFYNVLGISKVLRVLSLTLFLGAINSIQNSVISRKMEFKKLFFSSIAAIIVSGIIGVILALLGFGIWALVFQQLSNQIITTIVLWFTVKWRPQLVFSLEKIKVLFSYGWKVLCSTLLDTLYMNLRSLIVGKMYSTEILAYYNRGDQFPQLIITNINGSIQSVMLPILAEEQDNKKKVKEMVRRSIVTSSFIIFPMMIGLSVIAVPLVKVILTEKWLSCVPFLRIFCFSYALWPIHTANLQAINAIGRSDIYLKLEIVKKILGMIILIVSIQFGMYAIAIGLLINSIVSTFINSYPNRKLLNYSYLEQIRDVMPSFVLSFIMGGVIYLISFLKISSLITLLLQVIVGAILYVLMANIFKLECFTYLLNKIKEVVNKK